MEIRQVNGRTWRTPLSERPLRTVGRARLTRSHYRGMYHHNGVGGYEYYNVRGWLPVTGLQRKHGRAWRTWMVDDPVHWDGMREAVDDLPPGRIVVAGLGLGLMLHHMAAQPRFSNITVAEQDPDVKDLMWPTLPSDPRVQIVVADFYSFIDGKQGEYDGVLWDLAVGQPAETAPHMMWASMMIATRLGFGVPLVQFGVRRTPAPPLVAAGV